MKLPLTLIALGISSITFFSCQKEVKPSTTESETTGRIKAIIRFTYDDNGNETGRDTAMITYKGDKVVKIANRWHADNFVYDAAGRLIESNEGYFKTILNNFFEEEDSSVCKYNYYPDGKLKQWSYQIHSTDPSRQVAETFSYTYQMSGDTLVVAADYDGGQSVLYDARYYFNSKSILVKTVDPYTTLYYTHDNAGNVLAIRYGSDASDYAEASFERETKGENVYAFIESIYGHFLLSQFFAEEQKAARKKQSFIRYHSGQTTVFSTSDYQNEFDANGNLTLSTELENGIKISAFKFVYQ